MNSVQSSEANLIDSKTIFIDVPPLFNAAEIARLRAQIDSLRAGDIAVLRGSRAVFCQGMDLALAANQDAAQLHAGLQSYADLLLAVRCAPCVVIALVEGGAFGGGVGLAAACDFVLASTNARFGLPEALHGFYPAIVFAVLEDRLTPQKARQLALLCESVSAEEGRVLGLVDSVCDHEVLSTALQRQIRRLRRAAPAGVLAIKRHPPHLDRLRAELAQATQVSLNCLLAPSVAQALVRATQEEGV